MIDDLRAKFPHLGFAVYAYKPGGQVTLEIHAPDSEVFTFYGPTLEHAVLAAFPPAQFEDPQEPDPQPVEDEPENDVFD